MNKLENHYLLFCYPQEVIAACGCVAPLVHLLDSELEDVLVNAVNAIRVLCVKNTSNQTAVGTSGALEPLVEFLTVSSGRFMLSFLCLHPFHYFFSLF